MKRSILFPLAFVSIISLGCILSTLALVCMVSLGCSTNFPFSPTVRGSGHLTRETRPVSGFTGVDLQAVGEVTITMGDVDSVVVEADDNILPLLKTDLVGSQLIIARPSAAKLSTGNPIRFIITMKQLEQASLSGTGDININGLDADQVKFDLPGTGQITAKGKVGLLNVSLPGTGKIVCDALEADTVVADHDGAGEITVRARRSLDARISGHGSINYYGDPTDVSKTVTGYAKINKLP